jgi:hypothetical protein
VAVLSGGGADFLSKDDPILQGCIFERQSELIAEPSLAGQGLRAIPKLANDAAGHLPQGKLLILSYGKLVGGLSWRLLLPHPNSFPFRLEASLIQVYKPSFDLSRIPVVGCRQELEP